MIIEGGLILPEKLCNISPVQCKLDDNRGRPTSKETEKIIS